jgi:hypothetical protein
MPPFHRRPPSFAETAEFQRECRPGTAINGWQGDCHANGVNDPAKTRMVLHVDQLASPWSIFLTEDGSLRKMLVSPGSTGQKT